MKSHYNPQVISTTTNAQKHTDSVWKTDVASTLTAYRTMNLTQVDTSVINTESVYFLLQKCKGRRLHSQCNGFTESCKKLSFNSKQINSLNSVTQKNLKYINNGSTVTKQYSEMRTLHHHCTKQTDHLLNLNYQKTA